MRWAVLEFLAIGCASTVNSVRPRPIPGAFLSQSLLSKSYTNSLSYTQSKSPLPAASLVKKEIEGDQSGIEPAFVALVLAIGLSALTFDD